MAVMTPLKHRKWMCHKVILLMVGFWWLLPLAFALYHLALYHQGIAKVGYWEMILYAMLSHSQVKKYCLL